MNLSFKGLAALLGLGVVLMSNPAGSAADELKVGDKAPAFSLQGTDGKTYSLDRFPGEAGRRPRLVPQGQDQGCTAECKSLRENGSALRPLNVAYFTASVDTPELNQEFADELDLDYPILSDPSKSVAEAYGVLNSGRGVANRWTFYIDKDGIIKAIDKKVNTAQAGADVAEKVKELGLASE